MAMLAAGLLLFLGLHSLRVFAEPWRQRSIARVGVPAWRAGYSVLSLAGFLLILKGYADANDASTLLYASPAWTRSLATLLTLPALVLLMAAYVPGTHLKARVGHPMLLGTLLWALGHLAANGRVADVALFGGFALWSGLAFAAARSRDRAAGTTWPARGVVRDAIAVVAGVTAWVAILFWLHGLLSGVPLR